MLRTRAHPCIEQAAITGLITEPITVVSVVDNIKQVCCVAGVVIAGSSSLHSFDGTFSKSATRCRGS